MAVEIIPERFRERIAEQLGAEEASALCRALDTESPTALRLHPVKRCSCELSSPIPWSKWGYYLDSRPSFTLDPKFHAGAYYVQEASSQFVGRVLQNEQVEGCRLLDLCAAPGGKSTLYSSLVGSQGLVVANEIDRRRVQVLADNVRKWGLGNVVVTTNDSKDFSSLKGWFDVVAIDAPCSGEGMFRRLPISREEWSERGVAQCSAIQRELLHNLWESLKPGGVLIYSTCTFNSDEDEDVLRDFMQSVEGETEPVDKISEAEQWGIVTGQVGDFRTYRFFPHRAKGEGFFCSVVRRRRDVEYREKQLRGKRGAKSPMERVDNKQRAALSEWVQRADKMSFYRAGEMLYGCYKNRYEDIERLSEVLRVIYSGVALGELYKGKLKPDAALALFAELRPQAVNCVELEREEALEYLRKGELSVEKFVEGMNLVLFEGLALGFAKRISNRINNLYPNSLRIMNK